MSFEDLSAIEVAVVTFSAYMICLNTYFWLRSLYLQVSFRTMQNFVQYLRDLTGARPRETMDVLLSSRLQLRRESDVHCVCAVCTLLCSAAFVEVLHRKLRGMETQWTTPQHVAFLIVTSL
eukprot:TRINITY_DN6450_c0_g1_i2.p2 TRINITY_DN6450_c0_g1~~TRINITY_DN6450_c0_g1_i2.p2  ORF type:complete len:138 (+),score=6.54 TRINITY_DN6450_c0_g1_i2:52-414(+)